MSNGPDDPTNELELNSLNRFSKSSDRLTLEAYDSCEVPAGCGGVVMRWVDPNDGIPLRFVGGFIADAKIYVDQKPVIGQRIGLFAGEHLLCIELSNFSDIAEAEYFAWRTHRDLPSDQLDHDVMTLADCTTAADGSWLASVLSTNDLSSTPDSPDWIQQDYDTAGWTALSLSSYTPAENYTTAEEWRIRGAADNRAEVLSLPQNDIEPASRIIRIRKSFSLEEGDV